MKFGFDRVRAVYFIDPLTTVPERRNVYLTFTKMFKTVTVLNKIHLGICIAPTQPFRAALGAESRVCYPGKTADRQRQ
jgi:hypothetical protein